MPPISRYRKKRTVYLSPADDDAVEIIRVHARLRTKASAIRYAVRNTERRITQPSTAAECASLIEYVEKLDFLSPHDARELNGLCRAARAEIQ